MAREINLQLSLRITASSLVGAMAGFLLLASAVELGSESVTLTTYYPAPSGVYTQMITTSNTYLARDTGGVSIGTTNAGSAKLAVMGGKVGLGTTNPAQKLQISGGNLHMGEGAGFAASSRGYIYIDNASTGCSPRTQYGGNGSICTPGQYATFIPGIYIEGWQDQGRGGPVLAYWGPGAADFTTQVRALDGNGNENWATLTKNDSTVSVYCCPK